jgi:hypothetical protein
MKTAEQLEADEASILARRAKAQDSLGHAEIQYESDVSNVAERANALEPLELEEEVIMESFCSTLDDILKFLADSGIPTWVVSIKASADGRWRVTRRVWESPRAFESRKAKLRKEWSDKATQQRDSRFKSALREIDKCSAEMAALAVEYERLSALGEARKFLTPEQVKLLGLE